MKRNFLLLVGCIMICNVSKAQFVIKETDFEWFPTTIPSSRCAIEAIVPNADGTVEVKTFTQYLASVMVQTGVLIASANGNKYYPLMNTKKFDSELKLKSNTNDFFNYRMFISKDKADKKLFMMLKDRVSETVTVDADSNFMEDMVRKYPKALKTMGNEKTVFQYKVSELIESGVSQKINVVETKYDMYDERANVYRESTMPTKYIDPTVERKVAEGKRMESAVLLVSSDKSVMQRHAFLTLNEDADRWSMYKHRVYFTYDKDGVKTNEVRADFDFARSESFVSEVRNAEDNTTNGYLYIYHRVFGLGKKSQDTIVGNYDVVYLDPQGNKKFQYTFKISDKGNSFNPFVCYAKDNKIKCISFGHPEPKTMGVTTLDITPTGIENIQPVLLQDFKSLISGSGVSLNSWGDDGFKLHDAVSDANGFVYLIGEKRTEITVPGDASKVAGASPMPVKVNTYPSHIILVVGADGKVVRQHVIKKPEFALSVFEKSYELVTHANGACVLFKDALGKGSKKPFHELVKSDLSEVQKNKEDFDFNMKIIGLKGAKVDEFISPFSLYHSQKGVAFDANKKNFYFVGLNPENSMPRLFKVALW